jgi:hypothetical protein
MRPREPARRDHRPQHVVADTNGLGNVDHLVLHSPGVICPARPQQPVTDHLTVQMRLVAAQRRHIQPGTGRRLGEAEPPASQADTTIRTRPPGGRAGPDPRRPPILALQKTSLPAGRSTPAAHPTGGDTHLHLPAQPFPAGGGSPTVAAGPGGGRHPVGIPGVRLGQSSHGSCYPHPVAGGRGVFCLSRQPPVQPRVGGAHAQRVDTPLRAKPLRTPR